MNKCVQCGDRVPAARWALGRHLCMPCGEQSARAARSSWCVAPLHKGNYLLITDRRDLIGLNNKGGLVR